MNYSIFSYGIVSFLVVYFITPWLIKYLVKIGLVVKDQNKKDKPLVPISGGLAVLVGVFSGLLLFIFYRTFFVTGKVGLVATDRNLMLLFASMVSLFIITLVGFLDDLVIKSSKDYSIGLKQWEKPLLTLTAAVPLMVVNAGNTEMWLPIFSVVDIGIFYPLFIIPIGVVGASNMVNMLEGYNGLGTGMAIVYIGMLGIYAYHFNRYIAALIALVAFFSLIAFYVYNKCPAKILPGDSLTYLLGATIAIIAIVGNIEKAAIISAIPFFIEFVLKARSRFKAQSYGYYYKGKVKVDYDKIYSFPHVFARTGKFTEKQIVFFMILIQLFFSSLIWLI
ncbi:hypothetical protein J4230_01635 [Candidatus Woesearchaeota archaeon]|nr:hypothetical protein [Candidatus Woesearchaeota archaeon]